MWSSDSEPERAAAAATAVTTTTSTATASASPPPSPPPASVRRRRARRRRQRSKGSAGEAVAHQAPEPEAEDVWRGAQWEAAWPARRHPKPPVLLARAGDGGDDNWAARSRSLTDDDLEELRGCADLGFGFSYDEIPELRGTLPALELCYSMSQRLLDDGHHHHHAADLAPTAASSPAPPVTNWKISSPGDSPDEVKARLKYWAQAVACTVRLCS